jgi:hypothetical protein
MKIKEIILEKTTATPLGSLKNQPGFAQGFISGLVPGADQAFQTSRRNRIATASPYTDAPTTTSANASSSTSNISPEYQKAQQQAQQLAQRAAAYKPAKLGQVNPRQDQDNTYDVSFADGTRGIVRVGYKDEQGRDVPSRISTIDPNTKKPYSYSYDNTTREWRYVGGGPLTDPEEINNLNSIIQTVGQQAQQINTQAAAQQKRAANLQRARQNRKQKIAGKQGTSTTAAPATAPEQGTP